MNVREGMRRLALILGVLGAILGGFIGQVYNAGEHLSAGESAPAWFIGSIVGFLIPWVAVRALSWVLTGFAKSNQP